MPLQQLSLSATTRPHYGENDELEVIIGVSGAAFSGSLVAYDDHRKLAAFCNAASGFPRSPGDAVSFDYGIFDRLKVSLTANAKGHVSATAVLEKWGAPAAKYQEVLSVQFWCDPSSSEEFCRSISAFEPHVPSEARLVGRAADR